MRFLVFTISIHSGCNIGTVCHGITTLLAPLGIQKVQTMQQGKVSHGPVLGLCFSKSPKFRFKELMRGWASPLFILFPT